LPAPRRDAPAVRRAVVCRCGHTRAFAGADAGGPFFFRFEMPRGTARAQPVEALQLIVNFR